MGYNIWPKIISSTTLSQSQKQQREYPSITIQLLESVLYNHQTHNPVLRGVVELRFKKPIAVSSLRLEFHGYLDYRLVEPGVSCQKKFAECSLPLYPASPASSLSNPLVIQDHGDKPTRFVFEMPLPNNTSSSSRQSSLIQSIQCNEVQVNYQIKAVIEYHQYHDTSQRKEAYIKRRSRKSAIIQLLESPSYPVVIIQIPTNEDGSSFLTSDNMYASIDSRKQSNHWCQYRVKIDKRFAAISSMISLSVRIAPLIHGLKLAQVSMHIVQRFTITPASPSSSSSPQTFSRPPIPLECHHQSTPYPSSSSKHHTGGTLYEGEFQYKIPSSSTTTATLFDQVHAGGLVPSIQTNTVSNIKVEHHLLVYLALTYPKMSHDGILRRARRLFTFQCDFDLLHPCMDDHISNELLRLPAYDDVHACVSTKLVQPSSPPPTPPPRQCHDDSVVTLVNEFFHHHALSSTLPMYHQAILLPPAVL
ncbi:unnamed protein product [Absidia cylindrospora]